MPTINSSLTAYATPTDVFTYVDIRNVADYCSDTNVRLGGAPNPTPATVAASPILAKALLAASGKLESACLRSKRYSADDLNALLLVDCASQQLLIQIVVGLTYGALWKRRPNKEAFPPIYKEALEWLESLANGEAIFAFAETEDAGLPYGIVETPAEICERGLVAQEAIRYFGRTGDLIQNGGCVDGGCGGGC